LADVHLLFSVRGRGYNDEWNGTSTGSLQGLSARMSMLVTKKVGEARHGDINIFSFNPLIRSRLMYIYYYFQVAPGRGYNDHRNGNCFKGGELGW